MTAYLVPAIKTEQSEGMYAIAYWTFAHSKL